MVPLATLANTFMIILNHFKHDFELIPHISLVDPPLAVIGNCKLLSIHKVTTSARMMVTMHATIRSFLIEIETTKL